MRSNKSFNFGYLIGDNLREYPIDKASFLEGIEDLIRKCEECTTIDKRIGLYSRIGVFYRICGNVIASFEYLQKADKLITNNHKTGTRIWKINQIRLAQTYQYQAKYQKSIAIYEALMEQIVWKKEDADLLDYVYQHQGKVFFEQGNYLKAKAAILKAIALRQIKEDAALIQSSEKALQVIEERMQK